MKVYFYADAGEKMYDLHFNCVLLQVPMFFFFFLYIYIFYQNLIEFILFKYS